MRVTSHHMVLVKAQRPRATHISLFAPAEQEDRRADLHRTVSFSWAGSISSSATLPRKERKIKNAIRTCTGGQVNRGGKSQVIFECDPKNARTQAHLANVRRILLVYPSLCTRESFSGTVDTNKMTQQMGTINTSLQSGNPRRIGSTLRGRSRARLPSCVAG